MSTVTIDLESDGLLPFCRQIWCVSVLDSSGECVTYTDKESFLAASQDWGVIIGHNLVAYDLWVLWLIWQIPFTVGKDTFNGKPVTFFDTLVGSRYQNPDRIWGHSLENWGTHLGFSKGSHSDWSQYSEEMRTYCEQDTRVCYQVYKFLEKERNERQ